MQNAKQPPAGRVARDGSVNRGMPSAARRGSLARLPIGKGAGVPQEGIFCRQVGAVSEQRFADGILKYCRERLGEEKEGAIESLPRAS